MTESLLRAFRVLDSKVTFDDMLETARRLFIESDPYTHADCEFLRSEVDAIANAILEYTTSPELSERKVISFQKYHAILGSSIEYGDYASICSEELLVHYSTKKLHALKLDDLRKTLKQLLLAMCYRYTTCVQCDHAVFPLSVLLTYMNGVRTLFSRNQEGGDLSEALWTTLGMLVPRQGV
jgi:hypothetical protein